ncbi:MAG: DNA-3-methyladenine glycosylase [Gammaproteobacteria bacterium]|nr:DNA-3-methyladenine glycosylase [Gammaproteobacteria bacterium]
MKKLPRAFFDRDTVVVAKALLGQYLVHIVRGKKYIGKIVEVEAYIGPQDLACHSARGLTKRTAVMFGPPGHAYVYLIYGMHHCMNVVTESEGHASAVLLRALEPVENIATRTQGPGLLSRAMHITTTLNGYDLTSSQTFYIAENISPEAIDIVAKPRIGVEYAGKWKDELLRFYVKGNPFISKK